MASTADREASARIDRLRRDRGGKAHANGIGPVVVAVASPDYPAVIRALSPFWEGKQLEQIAAMPGATLERVAWLIESAWAKVKRGEMDKGEAGIPGHIRNGIKGGWTVPADWLVAKSERLAAGAGT